uniref:Uncharacterized protein n=1 Tax=Manihot esculenta TaxID=3983 RepID=A0A2C9UG66_MANES
MAFQSRRRRFSHISLSCLQFYLLICSFLHLAQSARQKFPPVDLLLILRFNFKRIFLFRCL